MTRAALGRTPWSRRGRWRPHVPADPALPFGRHPKAGSSAAGNGGRHPPPPPRHHEAMRLVMIDANSHAKISRAFFLRRGAPQRASQTRVFPGTK